MFLLHICMARKKKKCVKIIFCDRRASNFERLLHIGIKSVDKGDDSLVCLRHQKLLMTHEKIYLKSWTFKCTVSYSNWNKIKGCFLRNRTMNQPVRYNEDRFCVGWPLPLQNCTRLSSFPAEFSTQALVRSKFCTRRPVDGTCTRYAGIRGSMARSTSSIWNYGMYHCKRTLCFISCVRTVRIYVTAHGKSVVGKYILYIVRTYFHGHSRRGPFWKEDVERSGDE